MTSFQPAGRPDRFPGRSAAYANRRHAMGKGRAFVVYDSQQSGRFVTFGVNLLDPEQRRDEGTPQACT